MTTHNLNVSRISAICARLRPSRLLTGAILLGLSLVANSASAAFYQLDLTVQPNQSFLQMFGHLGGVGTTFPLEEQTPGSLITSLGGTLTAVFDYSGGVVNSIQFVGGNKIQAIDHPGAFLPGFAPADFAFKVDYTSQPVGVVAYGAYRNFEFGLTGGPLAVDGSGQFNPTDIVWMTATADYSWVLPTVSSGSETAFVNETIALPLLPPNIASIELTDTLLTVTLPFTARIGFIADGNTTATKINYYGQIVATYCLTPIPEPSTWILASIGVAAVGLARLRRGRSAS
jgi:hypothetical protein